MCTRVEQGGCLWWAIVRYYVVKTTRPSGAKVERSVPDASVPPTGVKTIRICLPRPPYAAVPAMAHGPPSPG